MRNAQSLIHGNSLIVSKKKEKGEITYMTLGEKIKLRRNVLGLSQVELAKKSGVGQSYISELENGKFNPTSKTLAALAGPLKCTTDYLIFDGKKAG